MSLLIAFGEILEAADQLSREEQEQLIATLHRRLIERGREQLVSDVQEARHEFVEGVCKPSSTADLMDEILS